MLQENVGRQRARCKLPGRPVRNLDTLKMPPDAHYAADSSDSDSDDESGTMAEDKVDRASTDDQSPTQAGGAAKPHKPSTKANAKDANRPKRKKARRACYACQRAHLTCGMPCPDSLRFPPTDLCPR